MKLIIVIMGNNDGKAVTDELNRNGFKVTKLFSYGGFLKAGNTTLLIGVRNSRLDSAIDIIKRCCKHEKQLAECTSSSYPLEGYASDYPCEYIYSSYDNIQASPPFSYSDVTPGSAVLFVINVKRYEKVIDIMEELLSANSR